MAKLIAKQVAEIRASEDNCKALATRHGVTPARIWQVRQGNTLASEMCDRMIEWRKADPERARESNREACRRWRTNNPDKVREASRRSRAKKGETSLAYKTKSSAAR